MGHSGSSNICLRWNHHRNIMGTCNLSNMWNPRLVRNPPGRIKSGKVIHHPVWCEKGGVLLDQTQITEATRCFIFSAGLLIHFLINCFMGIASCWVNHHFPSDDKDPGLNWPQLSLRLWKLLPAAIVEVDFLKAMKQNETKKLWFSITSLNNQSVKPPIGLEMIRSSRFASKIDQHWPFQRFPRPSPLLHPPAWLHPLIHPGPILCWATIEFGGWWNATNKFLMKFLHQNHGMIL